MTQLGTGSRTTAGLIDAHSHARATSYSDHGIGGSTLEEGLLRMTAATRVDSEDDAYVASAELIEKGVTGVQVMFHTFGDPDDYLAVLDATISGLRRSGIRALIVLGTTDQAEFLPPSAMPAPALAEIIGAPRRMTPDEFGAVVERATGEYPDVAFGVGPVGPQWCSDELLHVIGDISQRGFRVHSHFAEGERQRSWAGDLMARMKQARLLGPRTSLAHAVWVTDDELREIADLGVSLVTCPLSNHLLSAGTARVAQWQAASVRFGVGLDSADRTATPVSIATRALSIPDAMTALTAGGTHASGIDSSADLVEWSDDTMQKPHRVVIDGVERVVGGRLVDHASVEQARARIADALHRDTTARARRHQTLDAIMPEYVETVRQAVDAR